MIRFDQRGMGLSSRASLDEIGPSFWAEDAIAVMDAAGCEQATIFGSGFTAMSGLVLAAEYPERVRSLVIVNGAPAHRMGTGLSGMAQSRAGWIRSGPSQSNPMQLSRASTFCEPSRQPSRMMTRFERGGTTRAIARRRRAWHGR